SDLLPERDTQVSHERVMHENGEVIACGSGTTHTGRPGLNERTNASTDYTGLNSLPICDDEHEAAAIDAFVVNLTHGEDLAETPTSRARRTSPFQAPSQPDYEALQTLNIHGTSGNQTALSGVNWANPFFTGDTHLTEACLPSLPGQAAHENGLYGALPMHTS